MRYLHLLLRNLGRRKVRTVFTFLAVVAAFFLFGFLMAVKNGFDAGIQIAGQKRLLTIHKVSIILQLPLRCPVELSFAVDRQAFIQPGRHVAKAGECKMADQYVSQLMDDCIAAPVEIGF